MSEQTIFSRSKPRVLVWACMVLSASISADESTNRSSDRDLQLTEAISQIGHTPGPSERTRTQASVAPDGTGLPDGVGTAKKGRGIYDQQCAGCHGLHGEGSRDYPALVGGKGTLATDRPLLTVGSYWPFATTVWDYIHRAMPYQAPGSLSSDDVYALTAYILFMNGIVKESEPLNRHNLPLVRMPNRNGFIDDPRPDVPQSSSSSPHQ